MNKKYLYTVLVGCAIALNTVPLDAQEDNAQEDNDAKDLESAFVCGVKEGTPTMFAYTPGEVELTPLMTWHAEYLLPEQSGTEICKQTAAKLQNFYEQDQARYLKAETSKEQNLVCLVREEEQNCITEDSQKLFSVNPKYNAGCVLENKNPIECKALQVRGVYSFEDKPYQPMWWPW
ncbi:MAG: COP23 domain-containing protein [Cyanobacteria bacterium P01_A01_bin.83]